LVNPRVTELEEAIKSYESGKLKMDIASLKRQFTIEVSYATIIPIIAAILSAIFVNLAAIAAPIAIGAANIADKVGLSKTILSSYSKDKYALKERPVNLRGRLQLARIEQNPNDQNKMLDDIVDKLSSYWA